MQTATPSSRRRLWISRAGTSSAPASSTASSARWSTAEFRSAPKASSLEIAAPAFAGATLRPSLVAGEPGARGGDFRPRLALAGELHEACVVLLCLRLLARLRSGKPGAVVAAQPVRLANLRGFVLFQRVGRALELEQHVA